MIRTISADDHLKEELKNPEFAVAYLNESMKTLEGETAEMQKRVFLKALRLIIEANGITNVAKESGVNRANVYRQISEKGNPRIETLISILDTLDLELQFIPKNSR